MLNHSQQALATSAIRRNLRRLNIIRSIAIGGQFLALYYFGFVDSIGLPVATLSWVLIFYTVILLITSWRSLWRQPITELEFFAHLLVDILFFSTLLYFSGGASNPFISYYLVPISIAATTLPWTYTWAITLLSLAAYSLLLFNNVSIDQLAPDHGAHHSDHGEGNHSVLNLHLIGMWATFAISAGLITYFVVKMASELRQQQQRLTEQRENQLLDDQVLAVATLAAGTAHELGTPLNTMQILLDEMEVQPQSSEQQKDITTLKQQIEQCRKTLKQLVATADIENDQHLISQPIRGYIDELMEHWEVLRPTIKVNTTVDATAENVTVHFPPTVSQALHNLLNNAADASDAIDVSFTWDQTKLVITIRDYGPGIVPELIEQLGRTFVTTKPGGLGIGLFLTQSTIQRIGGQISLTNADNGGTLTQVTLPIAMREQHNG